MKVKTKAWLLTATALVLFGSILFAGVMTMLKWDFMKLSTVEYETNTHEIIEAFEDISINTDTADILFALSNDGKCRVECYEAENAKHSVTVENNMLVIRINNQKPWYEYVGFNIGSPRITVYLPKAEYASLLIKEDTGDIEIPKEFEFKNIDISVSTGNIKSFASASEFIKIKGSTGCAKIKNISAGSLDISLSTGDIAVSDVTCKGDIRLNTSTGDASVSNTTCQKLVSSASTGNAKFKNVIATEKFSIERDTGDVVFDKCDAAELFIKTDTGDVLGSLLSDKVFITETDTGSIDVPKTVTGGRCEISTDTGDIKIETD